MVASNQLSLLDYREATQFLIDEGQIGNKQHQPCRRRRSLPLWLGAGLLIGHYWATVYLQVVP